MVLVALIVCCGIYNLLNILVTYVKRNKQRINTSNNTIMGGCQMDVRSCQ